MAEKTVYERSLELHEKGPGSLPGAHGTAGENLPGGTGPGAPAGSAGGQAGRG